METTTGLALPETLSTGTTVASGDRLARGFAIAGASALVLSFTGILLRLLTHDCAVPALVVAFWRNLLTSGSLALVLLVVRPKLLWPGQRNLGFLASFALVLAGFNTLFTLSVAHAGAALSTILVYTSGAFTVLIGRILLKERLGLGKAGSVVCCLVGCVLVAWPTRGGRLSAGSGEGLSEALGIGTGVLAGAAYAVYSILGRVAHQRGLNPWTTLLYSFAGAAAILGVVEVMPLRHWSSTLWGAGNLLSVGLSGKSWLLLFVLALGPTLAGFGLYNVSLSLLNSGTANLVLTLETPLTALLAWALLDERLTLLQIGGGLIILIGVLVLARSDGSRESATTGKQPSRAAQCPASLSDELSENGLWQKAPPKSRFCALHCGKNVGCLRLRFMRWRALLRACPCLATERAPRNC